MRRARERRARETPSVGEAEGTSPLYKNRTPRGAGCGGTALLADVLRVLLRSEELVEISGAADAHAEHPSVAIGIAVDDAGLALEGVVHRRHFPGHGTEQLGD